MASVLLVFGGAIFSPYARAVAPSTYIKQTVDAAQGVQRQYKVPASVALAQSILESGWGDSSLSRTYHNYFGIKCTSQKSPFQQGCVSLQTKEYSSSGTSMTIVDGFRTYATTADSFSDYGLLLSSLSRYRAAFSHTDDPNQFIRDIAAGGYATDPQYADLVIRIMQQYNLYQYDKISVSPPTAAAVANVTSTAPTVTASTAPATTKASTPATATPSPATTTSSPSRATATATAAPSTAPSHAPTISASAAASTAPTATAVSTDKKAGLDSVIWVINPQTDRVYFSGPVYDGSGKLLANASFQVVDTTGATLGTVTTDAQGRLDDSLQLPANWAKIPNFEVTIRIQGSTTTTYTEGSTTLPAGNTAGAQSGALTGADPTVASARDTGLDRDHQLPTTTSPSASSHATSTATPTSHSATPIWPAGRGTPSASGSVSASASASATPSPSPSGSTTAVPTTPAATTGGGSPLVDRAANAITARLPRTGGPAAIIGLLGLGTLAAGATLLHSSRRLAPRDQD
ncbi:glucosaminidase domain-containing protein [Raineyella fluvialis]|uniref:glucosaminidase domain-containing protein n=1 Tax=Raineyella fluvialis TaxID=2662261 RepID=UPI0018908C42|nr:glucosaminidase domain-containing protein [Raineyella fluvialis]